MRWKRLASAVVLCAIASVDGLGATVAAQPDDIPNFEVRFIRDFAATIGVGRVVTFHWQFKNLPEDAVVVCSLNVDTDNVIMYTIQNCQDERTARHRYEAPGRYVATLTARIRRGGSDQKTTVVEVPEDPQPQPPKLR